MEERKHGEREGRNENRRSSQGSCGSGASTGAEDSNCRVVDSEEYSLHKTGSNFVRNTGELNQRNVFSQSDLR